MSRVEPSLFEFWGREVVKDATLLLLAIPPLVGLLFVPMGLSNGRWWVPLAFVVVGGLVWWLARQGLRAWVARGGDRAKGPEVTLRGSSQSSSHLRGRQGSG